MLGMNRLALGVWLVAVFLLLVFVLGPVSVRADPMPDLQVCEATDEYGEFIFPIAGDIDLGEACVQFGGELVMVPAMSSLELMQWMMRIGFYDPYPLLEDISVLEDEPE